MGILNSQPCTKMNPPKSKELQTAYMD